MTRILLFLTFSLFYISSFGQAIDVPKKHTKSIPDLAQFLTENADTQEEKVIAIYQWITHNIEYDYKKLEADKCFSFQGPEDVLKSKKALCTGYTRLMQALLDEIHIESEIVSGYTYGHKQYFIPETILDNHVWLAIQINGEWRMADPTWDAGYIGSISSKKVRDKLEAKQAKIELKNIKRKAKGKDTIPHLNVDSLFRATPISSHKQGFIFEPSTKWMLPDTRDFLMRHLPANPMWQLRSTPISVETFLKPDPVLEFILEEDGNSEAYNPLAQINAIRELNFLDKIVAIGDDAYQYYPKNTRIRAFQYHHYLAILNEKEVQKHFNSLDIRTESQLYNKMLQRIDTTLAYAKISLKNENVRYKETTSFFKSLDKHSKAANKLYASQTKKGSKSNDKAIIAGNKKLEKLPAQIAKLQSDIEKLETKGESKNTIENDSLFAPIQADYDSLVAIQNAFSLMAEKWKNQAQVSKMEDLYKRIYQNEFLFQQRALCLSHKSISFNDYLDTINIVLKDNFSVIQAIYSQDLKFENLQDDLYGYTKQANSWVKELKTKYATRDDINNKSALLAQLYFMVNSMRSELIDINYLAINHNEWLISYLKEFYGVWKSMEKAAEAQVQLTEEKNEYLLEQAEHEHNRELDLCKSITENCKAWQVQIKKRYL